MDVQHSDLVKAFDVWESEFRLNPSKFMSYAEVAALDTLPVSEQRAACLVAILAKLPSL